MVISIILGGLVTSFIFSLIVLASWKFSPEVWLSDLTQGKIQAPKTWKTYSTVVAIIAIILGGAGITAWWVGALYAANFYERFIAAWLVIVILNVVDVLVIDIWIYMWIYPTWMRIEGIEPLHDPRVHTKESLVGLVFGIPVAAIAAILIPLF
ncbi:MAG: hypothetical protein AAGD25_34065 [Cyanobacteria bacterium P01_F01_bin.150]